MVSEIWFTPCPVRSETSATFFGFTTMVTGSNCAIVVASSVAASRAASR